MLYQLLRTTPYLSGQVMNNLIISKTSDGITIDKLDITPLTDKISFNDADKREFLNYTHEENIKHIYREVRDEFFACTQNFIGEKFIYSQDFIDTHDHTYLSGLRRMRYNQYNKQFSFLIPLWISEDIDFNKLKFNILVKKQGTDFYNIRTSVGLSEDIAEYYNEFFSGVNDDLINLRLDTNEAFLSGLSVETGLPVVKNVSYLVENILSMERPLLEFDYLFSSLFKENKVVSKQLINFNLVFNLMDLTANEVINYESMFAGKPLNIIVEVLYDGKILTKKDLYTNYEYIPITITDGIKTEFHSDASQDYNALKYLGDNKMTDFIYTNKLTQPVHHWSLLENPDALFNLYDGFSAHLKDEVNNEFYRIQGHFQNQGDLSLREYNIYDNNLSWCKYFYYGNMSKFDIQYNLITKDETYTDVVIDTSKPTTWINGNKFEINYIDEDTDGYLFTTGERFRFKIIECTNNGIYGNNNLDGVPSESFKSFTYKLQNCTGNSEKNVVLISPKNSQNDSYLIFFSNTKNGLTLETIRNSVLGEVEDDDYTDTFDKFKRILNGYIKPYKIVFNKTVRTFTDGDKLKTNYVYNNDKNVYRYVYRYFGKVIPFFIDINDENLKNFDYYYEQWNDINKPHIKQYNKLLSEGYTPIYPDVKLDDEHYFYSLKKDEFYKKWNWEFTNGLENRVFNLPEEIHLYIEVSDYINKTQLQINNEVYLEFEKYFKNYFESYLGIKEKFPNDTDKSQFICQFISPLYDKEAEFDYISETNVKSLLFDIKYSLK
jgi:hypothetical protein